MRPALLLLLVLYVAPSSASAQEAQTDIETARKYITQLHERMRDPDSFVLERVFRRVVQPLTKQEAKRLGKKGAAAYERTVGLTEFCIEYRSRNGFGGMDRGVADTLPSGELVVFDPDILDLVGRSCPAIHPSPSTDMTSDVLADLTIRDSASGASPKR